MKLTPLIGAMIGSVMVLLLLSFVAIFTIKYRKSTANNTKTKENLDIEMEESDPTEDADSYGPDIIQHHSDKGMRMVENPKTCTHYVIH